MTAPNRLRQNIQGAHTGTGTGARVRRERVALQGRGNQRSRAVLPMIDQSSATRYPGGPPGGKSNPEHPLRQGSAVFRTGALRGRYRSDVK
jgi:hypothetical protein